MNNPKTICPLNFVEVGGIKGEKYKTLYLHFGCITEKPYSKPLERNVVYIPIITLRPYMWYLPTRRKTPDLAPPFTTLRRGSKNSRR